MDPFLLFLVRVVILVFFLFLTSLVIWARSVVREKNKGRVIIASLRRELQETEISPLESHILASSVIDFALAYYKRKLARGKKLEPANEAMKLCWRCLPTSFQEELAPLGGLADLTVGDNLF